MASNQNIPYQHLVWDSGSREPVKHLASHERDWEAAQNMGWPAGAEHSDGVESQPDPLVLDFLKCYLRFSIRRVQRQALREVSGADPAASLEPPAPQVPVTVSAPVSPVPMPVIAPPPPVPACNMPALKDEVSGGNLGTAETQRHSSPLPLDIGSSDESHSPTLLLSQEGQCHTEMYDNSPSKGSKFSCGYEYLDNG